MMKPHHALFLLTVALSSPAVSNAQMTDAQITQAVDRIAPAMIELRHQVHQHPELSNREFETSKLVAKQLQSLGLEVQTGIAHTGAVAILKGGKPGQDVAVAHACGHDIHIAAILGVATVLASLRDQLHGTVMFKNPAPPPAATTPPTSPPTTPPSP